MHSNTQKAEKFSLYVVATPIGNLRDISLRALDILGSVDFVAAEDTRMTSRLLSQYSLNPRLIAVHEHNERQSGERIVSLLADGNSVALVTDAGTPAISDPGALVVAAVRAAGYRVVPVPGASAVIAALSASGLTHPHFLFYGFLPVKGGARREALTALRELPYTLVFYEAPHRILDTAADLAKVLGAGRTAVIARELTKMFETVESLPLGDAVAWLEADPNRQRGEFVLAVSGAPARPEGEVEAAHAEALEALLEALPLKQAVDLAVRITGAPRNLLYSRALEWKRARE